MMVAFLYFFAVGCHCAIRERFTTDVLSDGQWKPINPQHLCTLREGAIIHKGLTRDQVDNILKNAHSYSVTYADLISKVYELHSIVTYFNFFNIEYGYLSVTSEDNVYGARFLLTNKIEWSDARYLNKYVKPKTRSRLFQLIVDFIMGRKALICSDGIVS